MYGILLISPQAPPELIIAARSRADFLAALKMSDTPHNWHRAVSHFTVAREVSGFYDARRALDEVRRHCPQYYLDCRFLLCRFLYRIASRREGDSRRTIALFVGED